MAKVDPHSFYDDLEPKIKSFDLKMKIDFENQAILSSVKLNFEREVTGKIHLDSRDLQINSVHLEDGTELSFKVDDKKPIVGNLLEIDFSKPSQSVVVNYEVKKESSALQWLKPEQTKGKVAPYLFTQCQPHHARSLIPLQDSPSVRVTYSAEISVRKQWFERG